MKHIIKISDINGLKVGQRIGKKTHEIKDHIFFPKDK